MKIDEVIESDEGTLQFKAELNPEEVQFVMKVGVQYLLKIGAIPFQLQAENDQRNFVQPDLFRNEDFPDMEEYEH